jgi:hypothetical protein
VRVPAVEVRGLLRPVMLADCADPCIRGRTSKPLASAVAAANFMFMLSLLLRTGVWRPFNEDVRSC